MYSSSSVHSSRVVTVSSAMYLSVFSSSVHSSRVGHCVQCCICPSSLLLSTHHVLVTVSSAVSVGLLLLLSTHHVLVTSVQLPWSVCLLFFCPLITCGHCVQCCICPSSLLLSTHSRVVTVSSAGLSVFSSSVHSSRLVPVSVLYLSVFSSSVHSITCWSTCVQCCILPSSLLLSTHHVLVTGVQCCNLPSSLLLVHSSRVGHCVQCRVCLSSLLLSAHHVLVTVSSAVSVRLLFFCPLIACWSLCPVLYLSVFSSSVRSSRVGHCVQCCICPSSLLLSAHHVLVTVSSAVSVRLLFFCPLIACWSLCPVLYLCVFSSSVHSSRVGHCVQCCICPSSLLLSAHHVLVTVSSAVSVGTEMLEMDCHLTSDGCVVVSHDNNLLRQTGYDKTVSSLRFQVFILTNKPALFISI